MAAAAAAAADDDDDDESRLAPAAGRPPTASIVAVAHRPADGDRAALPDAIISRICAISIFV